MRHVLGIMGVIAATILLVVSAMMNYQFGKSLGKTPTDGHIYGMASAAADCFKALAPFFFFAAIRNRVWSQAVAAALVWVVVTAYAMTSALGHAALNRLDTSGQRAVASANYQDVRADSKRAQDELKWIPAHRPPETVWHELNVLKAQRAWMTSKECTDITIRSSRDFCQQYFKLAAEHASGLKAQKLEARLAENGAKLAGTTGATAMAVADPQATVLAKLMGLQLETVQTGLTLFVALLIEIGSGFGMYVAFAYWRPNQSLHGDHRPASKTAAQAQPARKEEEPAATPAAGKDEAQPASKPDPIWTSEPPVSEAGGEAEASGPPPARPFGDNDNRNSGSARPAIMPPSDVERFYQEYVDSAGEGDWIASTHLNEAYKLWCKRNDRRPLAMPNFLAEFDKLKVVKHGIGGGVKYFGVVLKPDVERDLERKASRKRKVVPTSDASADQPKPAVDETTAAVDQLRAAADEMKAAVDRSEASTDEAKAA